MFVAAKISSAKGASVNRAISSVSDSSAQLGSVRDTGLKSYDNHSSGGNSNSQSQGSVNSEYAYTVDFSGGVKTSYSSEALQNSYISQATNSSSSANPFAGGLASLGSTGQKDSAGGGILSAWLGTGASGAGGGIFGNAGGEASYSANNSGSGGGAASLNVNGGTVGGVRQHDGSSYRSETLKSSYIDEKSQIATLNACLARQVACSSTRTGMGASYTVAEKMQDGATFGQAFNSTHGEKWRLGGNQTMNRTGAMLADNAGSAENPATFAIALVDAHSGPRFAASANTLKEIARGAGVPEENIKIATSTAQYNQFMQEAADANKQIVDRMRAEGTLGDNEKIGGLIVLHHSHGYSNGSGPEAHSGSAAFGGENQIERPQIQAKINGEFAWAAAMHGSCHSGGFDGKVNGLEANLVDAQYQARGTDLNEGQEGKEKIEFVFG